MKKNKGMTVLLAITVVSSLILLALLYVAARGTGEKEAVSLLQEYQKNYETHTTTSKSLNSAVHKTLVTWGKPSELYNVENQRAARESLDALIAEKTYTEDDMLFVYNPFGTNTQSLYVYFTTEVPMRASYRISVEDDAIATYMADCYAPEEYTTTHEYLLLGLMPNRSNRITLTLTDEAGNVAVRTLYYVMGGLLGSEKEVLNQVSGTSAEPLADGLYVHLGNDSSEQDFMYFYDNNGILRGEIPLIGYRSHRLVFDGEMMYFSISERRIAKMDRFGQVHAVYKLDSYKLHHDYVLDDNKNLLVLATDTTADTIEDRVLCIDTESGEVTEVLNLARMLSEYIDLCERKKEEPLDWIHVNAIQWLGEDSIVLSARESSSIIKVEDIYGIPVLSYIIADPLIYTGSGYEGYVLKKDGEFNSQMGQHTVTYVKDDSLPAGMYYLYMFNNNVGTMESRPDFDTSLLMEGLGTTMKKGETSYYYRYLVNEASRSYQLLESFAVPYSGYVSSAQEIGTHLLVDVGGRFAYYEYDGNRELIKGFVSAGESFLYRVYKYDFKGFYFR